MKGICIAAMNSNSGKTTISLALARLLANKNNKVKYLKSGPDFIDSRLGSFASKGDYGNVDIFMQKSGATEVGASDADYCVLEGVMGYLDGIYNTMEASTYANAKALGLKTVLVLTPKGEMFSLIAKLKGFTDYADNIVGVIFNKTHAKLYTIYKDLVEKELGLEVFGNIEMDEDFVIEDKDLGLELPSDIKAFDEKLDRIAAKLEKSIDFEKLLSYFEAAKTEAKKDFQKSKTIVAIAYDKAFNFYYKENIDFLEKYFNVKYFSVLDEEEVPEADLLYIGGGNLKDYLEIIEKSNSLESIKKYYDNGGKIFTEGEATYFLAESFNEHKMLSLIKGEAVSEKRLHNFGYAYLKALRKNFLFDQDKIFRSQEFHKSSLNNNEFNLFKVEKPYRDDTWTSSFANERVVAIEQNISFVQDEEYFYKKIDSLRGENDV